MSASFPTSRAAYWLPYLVGLLAFYGTVGSAFAQEEALSTREREAVALAEAGELAAENGRWADAVGAFRQAYAIRPAYTILFNLGYALRAMGRYQESRAAYERLLRVHGDAPLDILTVARTVLVEVEALVAHLSLVGAAVDPGQEVSLDGRPVEDYGERPLHIAVDPGEHSLIVRRPGYEAFSWRDSLEAGERRAISIDYEPLPEPESESVFSRPTIWIILGVIVAAAAGTTWYFLDRNAQLEPTDPTQHIVLGTP